MKKWLDFAAVIFDMDGLVLDTESTYIKAWQQAATAMGYDAAVLSAARLSGLHYQAVINELFASFGSTFDLSRFNHLSGVYWRDYVQQQGIEKKTGFDELLAVIQQFNLPFCLATNSAEINARECLALAGLSDVFPLLISRDDVRQGKPAPDIFLIAAQKLQQPIQRCLVLEDSSVGIQAAQAAGAIPVLIPSQPMLSTLEANEKISIFSDLKEVAKILNNLLIARAAL